jgi:membrane-bound metal-dependent hydrolase YbcI (DUF457 family)
MFIGHYGVSFAAKRAEPSVPLWVLFLSVQLLDVIWGPLVLLGIERVRITPGITEANALEFVYYPYTHSLVAAVVWAIVAAALYRLVAKSPARAALIVGLAVFSHWPLDLIMHAGDLPLYDDAAKVGLGLWHSRPLSYAVEILTLLIGFRVLLASRRGEPMFGTLVFVLALIASQGFLYYGPVPQSLTTAAWSAIVGYLLLAAIIWWLQDRRRSTEPA